MTAIASPEVLVAMEPEEPSQNQQVPELERSPVPAQFHPQRRIKVVKPAEGRTFCAGGNLLHLQMGFVGRMIKPKEHILKMTNYVSSEEEIERKGWDCTEDRL
ncbi:UNVERIFIED_CONTAM: hypothetical protein K2H54_025081 [Gekko kuhli]